MSARPSSVWSWPGVVAVILAACLGLGWAGALIVSAASGTHISDDGLDLLTSLGHTMAGAVAAYLGYQLGAIRKPPAQPAPDDPTPTASPTPARPAERIETT